MYKQVIVLRARYPDGKGDTRTIRKGKLIAQGAHASTGHLAELLLSKTPLDKVTKSWLENGSTKIAVYVNTEEELLALRDQALELELKTHLILDCGATEFGEPTYTALAIGPDDSKEVDKVTGKLPLL